VFEFRKDARQWLGRQEDGASCGVFFSTSSNIALLCLSRIISNVFTLRSSTQEETCTDVETSVEQSKIEGKYKSI
jgi:inorganic pyrophosphatase/exopolyphosphatase